MMEKIFAPSDLFRIHRHTHFSSAPLRKRVTLKCPSGLVFNLCGLRRIGEVCQKQKCDPDGDELCAAGDSDLTLHCRLQI